MGLGLLALTMLAGCADTPLWSSMSVVPTTEQFQAARGRQSSYIYFVAYEIYYDSTARQYTYRDGTAWVTRAEPPPGVAVGLLEASPSVLMDFHDAPRWHHEAVIHQYPRNWGRPKAIVVSAR